MILSGANLERVDLAMELICRAYGLSEVSVFLLSSHISISAKDGSGSYESRQVTIPQASIQLEKLKRLNRLSYTVVADTPPAEKLSAMLEEACRAREYKEGTILAGRMAAMICLSILFGGGPAEVISTAAITVVIHFAGKLIARADLNRLVGSALTMFTATFLVMLLYSAGIISKAPVIIITLSMIFIPGIPLVNAVRNLFCDHEMNGVLQLLKVFIETAALAAGIYAAVYAFRGEAGFSGQTVAAVSDPILLIILSFCTSVGFSIVFQIPPHDLWRAGIGGVLTRIVLILLPPLIPYRLIYTCFAALAAALYAEFLASRRKDPSTYFVYPSIVPLIPGDMFFHMILGILYKDWVMAISNGSNCFAALLGMSLGFVVSSSVAHYIRRVRHSVHRKGHRHKRSEEVRTPRVTEKNKNNGKG